MKKTNLALCLVLAATPLLAQEVTLPLARYDELRQLAHPEPTPAPPPAVAVALEEAVLDVEVGESSARITQELTLALYGDGWQTVALPQLGTFIEAQLGDLEGRLEAASPWALVARGTGRHRVRLTSVVPVTHDDNATRPTWRVALEAPAAAVVRGVLHVDKAVEEVGADAPALLSEVSASGDRTFVASPGERFAFQLFGAATTPPRARLPLRFEAASAAVLEVSRHRQLLRAGIAVRVLQGQLERLRLPLPAGFEVVKVGGGPIAGWDLEEGYLVVTPLAALADSLALTLELTGREAAAEIASPVIPVEGAAGLVLASKVAVRGDGLLILLDPGAGREPDAAQTAGLPPAFVHAAGRAFLLPVDGPVPRWQVSWAEGTEVLAAQVDRLRVDVVVGDAGRAAYQLWAVVRSSGAPQLGLALPGAELIAASRDGAPLVPGRSGESFVVPLSTSSEEQLVYLSLLLPLELPSGGGRLSVPIPRLTAPVARVEVRVLLPDGRRYSLADATRAGRVGPPPGTRFAEVPLLARQVNVNVVNAGDAVANAAFPLPLGFTALEAAWSALSSTPAPLAIEIEPVRQRQEWF